METTFITTTIFVVVVVVVISTKYTQSRRSSGSGKTLPPGPSFLTSNFLLLTTPFLRFEPVLKALKAHYGPIFTLSTITGPAIIISDHSLAHHTLVHHGAIFSDRPKSLPMCNMSAAPYGATWRLFRRNLTSEFIHPSRIRSYSWARKWVLQIFFKRLRDQHDLAGVNVIEHFRHAMFCLLVLMCFGQKVDENRIDEIARVQKDMLVKVSSGRFAVLTVFPRLGKMMFRSRCKELEKLCSDKEDVLIPLIKARIESMKYDGDNVAYVDTLVDLQLPEEEDDDDNGRNGERKLSYKEMVSMCSEFFNSGTDTTSTALQWIMANLVKYPDIQKRLYDEIVGVVGLPPAPPPAGADPEAVITEEEMKKMPYLKAVVLEGLRRHPPVHFVLPHRVMKEVEVQGYMIPEGATVNFMVGEMGLDPKVWDEPMEFRPERFLGSGDRDGVINVTGRKGIKMMPFGAGRRMCPGYDLALFHLKYFVANSVWYFDWTVPDGCRVDLTEEVELTVVMKNPLRARVSSRVVSRYD